MSDDATPPYNSLTAHDSPATILPIERAMAQKICLAVAQVLHVGYGEVTIIIADHQVRFVHTTLSDKF